VVTDGLKPSISERFGEWRWVHFINYPQYKNMLNLTLGIR